MKKIYRDYASASRPVGGTLTLAMFRLGLNMAVRILVERDSLLYISYFFTLILEVK